VVLIGPEGPVGPFDLVEPIAAQQDLERHPLVPQEDAATAVSVLRPVLAHDEGVHDGLVPVVRAPRARLAVDGDEVGRDVHVAAPIELRAPSGIGHEGAVVVTVPDGLEVGGCDGELVVMRTNQLDTEHGFLLLRLPRA